ncbi:hypothetical protein EYF80_027106 [Liparis tanakae]|uniref:Uncharacterized protein n=1 Tax=Liparis tanakae TaxID=230148 RepID=A0A4Z2HBM0_9TELE|nr:hypothetical protein EYF80_027106 [Liparis tanakae]
MVWPGSCRIPVPRAATGTDCGPGVLPWQPLMGLALPGTRAELGVGPGGSGRIAGAGVFLRAIELLRDYKLFKASVGFIPRGSEEVISVESKRELDESNAASAQHKQPTGAHS